MTIDISRKREVRKMPSSGKKGRFYCPDCYIEFDIEVESRYSTKELKVEFKKALSWIAKIETCPVCDRKLVKRPEV